MAQRNARAKKKLEIQPPTAEQMRSGAFEISDVTDKRNGGGTITIGKAYRRTPMIDTLATQGVISHAEHKALKNYRHHADMADRSLIRDSLCITRGGGDRDGPTRTMINASQVMASCEAAAGSLAPILRAVVVYDTSLSQWVAEHGGSVEQCRDRKGRRVCTIEPKRDALRLAQLEIKVAAGRVQAELDA